MSARDMINRVAMRIAVGDEEENGSRHEMEVTHVGYDEWYTVTDDDAVHKLCDERQTIYVYDPSSSVFKASNYFTIDKKSLWEHAKEDAEENDEDIPKSLNHFLLYHINAMKIVKILRSHMTLDAAKVIFMDYGDFVESWDDIKKIIEDNKDNGDIGFLDEFPLEAVADLIDNAVKETVDYSIERWLYDYDIDDCEWLKFKDDYDYTEIGDDCYVVYNTNKEKGNDIWNMFNCKPVECRIEIDGVDYFGEEGLSDIYSYDKEEVIAYMKKELGDNYDDEIDEFLEEELPECI